MSIHSSLKVSGGLRGSRNVWTRMERLSVLKKDGRWQDGQTVLGLPKVRTRFKAKSKKQLKAETVTATAEPGAEAAKPADKKA